MLWVVRTATLTIRVNLLLLLLAVIALLGSGAIAVIIRRAAASTRPHGSTPPASQSPAQRHDSSELGLGGDGAQSTGDDDAMSAHGLAAPTDCSARSAGAPWRALDGMDMRMQSRHSGTAVPRYFALHTDDDDDSVRGAAALLSSPAGGLTLAAPEGSPPTATPQSPLAAAPPSLCSVSAQGPPALREGQAHASYHASDPHQRRMASLGQDDDALVHQRRMASLRQDADALIHQRRMASLRQDADALERRMTLLGSLQTAHQKIPPLCASQQRRTPRRKTTLLCTPDLHTPRQGGLCCGDTGACTVREPIGGASASPMPGAYSNVAAGGIVDADGAILGATRSCPTTPSWPLPARRVAAAREGVDSAQRTERTPHSVAHSPHLMPSPRRDDDRYLAFLDRMTAVQRSTKRQST